MMNATYNSKLHNNAWLVKKKKRREESFKSQINKKREDFEFATRCYTQLQTVIQRNSTTCYMRERASGFFFWPQFLPFLFHTKKYKFSQFFISWH
jgi:hypothetical protein